MRGADWEALSPVPYSAHTLISTCCCAHLKWSSCARMSFSYGPRMQPRHVNSNRKGSATAANTKWEPS